MVVVNALVVVGSGLVAVLNALVWVEIEPMLEVVFVGE